jgi:hypothetical protein
MYISVIVSGYNSEKSAVNHVKKRLDDLLGNVIPEEILDMVGWENVEEDEDFVDYRIDDRLYKDEEGERFYVG